MPTYIYKCNACGDTFTVNKQMSKSSSPEDCVHCSSGETQKMPAMPQVVFKGDTWGDKNSRVGKQMAEKNKRLDVKQNEMKRDAPVSSLLPNVDGERVDSWSEAKKLAESKGKVSETYDNMVKKEIETKKQ